MLAAFSTFNPTPGLRSGSFSVDSCVGKIPWRRNWQSTPVFWLGNPKDRRAWRVIVHGVARTIGYPSASVTVCSGPRPVTLPSPPEQEGRGSPKTGPVGEGVEKERRLEEMKRVTRGSPGPALSPQAPGTAISGPGHPQESCFMWEEGWKAEMQTQQFHHIHPTSFSAVLLILSLQK